MATSKKVANYSQSVLFVLVILGFVVVGNYLLTRVFFRIDLTQNKEYTITKATKDVLRHLDDIVLVKACFSRNLPPQYKPIESAVRDMLAEYKAYAGNKLKITWIDPSENDKEKQKARELGIQEVRMNTFEKDKAQALNVFLGIAVIYQDKKEVMAIVQDPRRLEFDLTQAIMKVFRKETPKIAVLKTDTLPVIPPEIRMRMNMPPQPESVEEKYKPVFESLRNTYTVDVIDISEGKPIDQSYKSLIVPGGSKFTDRNLFEIDQYFMNGGNLIVFADAVKISFQYGPMAMPQNSKIMQLLEHYGARVENNMVLDASCGQVQIPQQVGPFQMNVAVPYPYFVHVAQDGFSQSNPAVSKLGDVILPWTSSVSLLVPLTDSMEQGAKKAREKSAGTSAAPVTAITLMRSSPKSWIETGNFNLNPNQEWKPDRNALKRSPLAVYLRGDFKSYFAGKSVPPVKEPGDANDSALSKIAIENAGSDRTIKLQNNSGNLVVVGSSGFITAQNSAKGNVDFVQNVVDWLSLSDNLISIRTRTAADRSIQKDLLKEGSIVPNIIRAVNMSVIPVILIIVGLAIYFSRKEAAVVVASTEAKEGDTHE